MMWRRVATALSLVATLMLCGCTAQPDAEVSLQVGELEVEELRLTAQEDGALIVTAIITNSSGVDRAFTIRWEHDGPAFERSLLVAARSMTTIKPADGFIVTGARGSVGDEVTLLVAQGFFSSSRDFTREVTVTVRSPDE